MPWCLGGVELCSFLYGMLMGDLSSVLFSSLIYIASGRTLIYTGEKCVRRSEMNEQRLG